MRVTRHTATSPIFVVIDPEDTTADYAYAVADTRLHTTRPLRYLAHHRLDQPPVAIPECPDDMHLADQPTPVHASGWLAGLDRQVECRHTSAGARLIVSDLAGFDLDRHQGVIRFLPEFTPAGAAPDLIEEVLLGPALLLQLAWRSVFALHAGAIEVNGSVVAFCAESGVGKSTLARACAGQAVADDILPIRLDPQPAALPCFSQLKWPASRQYALTAQVSLPLKAVCILDPMPYDVTDSSTVEVQPLESPESALALVRHTVASRLFSPELLQQHLHFCRDLAEAVPIRRLRYPKRLDILPHLFDVMRTL
jgi:hypothetical protein